MKTWHSYFLRIGRSLWKNLKRATAKRTVCMLVSNVMTLALLCPSGHAARLAPGVVQGSGSPPSEGLRFQPWLVMLIRDSKPAGFSFDKAEGRIEAPGERAGTKAARLLATQTPDPLLDIPVGVGTLALAPVAALGAAIGARERLSPDQLTACQADLVKAMGKMAAQERFYKWLLEVADEKCPGRLIPTEPAGGLGSTRDPVGVLLETRVEELRLERTSRSDSSYVLSIKTRSRLVQSPAGVVLCDQPAEYRSGECLFVDWTLRGALESVADTGYRQLAEEIVGRLLTTTDQPLLTGAGHGKPPTKRNKGVGLASREVPTLRPSPQFVSYPMVGAGTLGIYSTATVPHVAFQKPLTREEVGTELFDEVGWMIDDLDKHPNPIVSVAAVVAVAPISLWKQGAAMVRGLSPGKMEKADQALRAAAQQAEPHQDLALEVAHRLAPGIGQPVVLVNNPSAAALESDPDVRQPASRNTVVWLPVGHTLGTYATTRKIETGLEIHVQSAALIGESGSNPKLALCVEAKATLFRARDGQQLYSCPVQYRTEKRRFSEWAAHDAKLFREDLHRCYRELSAIIADRLVERDLVPADRPPQPTFAKR